MHINEFSESVANEVAARRAAMAAELPRLGAKLSEPVAGTRPATQLADAVRISAEARAAHLGVERATFPLAPFPSPVALAAALRAVLDAEPSAIGKAVEHLRQLLQQLAAGLPAGAGGAAGGRGVRASAAAALVHELLTSTGGVRTAAVAGLVRQLLAELRASGVAPSAGTVPPSVMERATAAVLLAVRQANSELSPPAVAVQARAGELPPALLSHFAQPAQAAKPRRAVRRKREERRAGFEPGDDAPEKAYLSRPERK